MNSIENIVKYKVAQLFRICHFYFDSFYVRGRLQNLSFKFENFT
jgi:hypothetical protein